ncbi:MAG: hypothetical protein ACP5SH_23555 [Syntrophobacteraceae bacterium]
MQSASIETFMNTHGISMQLMKMKSGEPRSVSRKEAVDRYKYQMSRQGRAVDFYVEASSEENSLSAVDVLFMLVLDASGCEMFKDYYGRHDEFKEMLSGLGAVHDEFDEFWLEFASRRRQSLKLRSFLGHNLYATLIEQFGFNN